MQFSVNIYVKFCTRKLLHTNNLTQIHEHKKNVYICFNSDIHNFKNKTHFESLHHPFINLTNQDIEINTSLTHTYLLSIHPRNSTWEHHHTGSLRWCPSLCLGRNGSCWCWCTVKGSNLATCCASLLLTPPNLQPSSLKM